MHIKNSPSSYGLIAKCLHWLIAILIIAVWGVGYYMTELPKDDASRMSLYGLHKSVGLCILLLVIIRFSWRMYNTQPNDAPMPKLMSITAHVVHYTLYILMFLQPISGWALSSSAGYPPDFFGLFTMPSIVPKDTALIGFYSEMHEFLAYSLLILVVLHVAGALYHHYIRKDNTLRKMTSG